MFSWERDEAAVYNFTKVCVGELNWEKDKERAEKKVTHQKYYYSFIVYPHFGYPFLSVFCLYLISGMFFCLFRFT